MTRSPTCQRCRRRNPNRADAKQPPPKALEETVEQTWGYMDHDAAETGHLVVIDQREGRDWEERSVPSGAAVEGRRAGGGPGHVGKRSAPARRPPDAPSPVPSAGVGGKP